MPDASRASHALFPGTFDPVTLGHVDLVARAARLFGRVTVAVATHPTKEGFFNVEQRVQLLEESTADISGVSVVAISGLVVQACAEWNCDVSVRGVRSGTDFDYEIQMARTNRDLSDGVETVLLAPGPARAHISSTLVRQVASMGGDVSAFVPACVDRALEARFS